MEGIETAGADRVRALALLAEGKVEDAAKAFAVGEGRDPADPRLLASSARFELARGDVERARMLSDRAAEVDAASIEARLAQALVARVRDRLPASLAYYDAALKEHPANFEARLGKADLLVVMEKYDDARPLVSGLFEEAPENRDIALLRAKLAARDGEWKQVRDILQAYEADMRDIPQMRLVYGEALLELGNGAQALTLLQPMLRANPSARDYRPDSACSRRRSRGAGHDRIAGDASRCTAGRAGRGCQGCKGRRKQQGSGVREAFARGDTRMGRRRTCQG